MPSSASQPIAETSTSILVGVCLLAMAASVSVLYLAWPFLVELFPAQHQLTVERSWYALRCAVPALVGVLCLPFIALHRRRQVALAVALASFACATLAILLEYQRVDRLRGDIAMGEALRQSDKFVWYGAAFAGLMGFGAGLTIRRRLRSLRRSSSTLYGKADWMPMKEAAELLPETGGIVIGERYRVDQDDVAELRFDPRNPDTWGKGGKAPLLAFDCSFGSTHGLVFAGSGGYKTSSVVVPTCLRWSGPIVCLDPTGEVGDMVYRVRSTSKRKVRILDPRRPKVGFNVLDWIGTGETSAEEDVATVVTWLMTESVDSSGNTRFFEVSARHLLTGVLAHVVFSDEYRGRRTLKALHEFMAQPEKSFRERLAQIHQQSPNKFVQDALGPFINLTEATFSGVLKGASAEIEWLAYDRYDALVSGNTFDPKQLVSGEIDVFISIDLATLKAHPALGRVIIGALLNTAANGYAATHDRVLFMIDEARMLGTMSQLEVIRDAFRKYEITLVLVYQSLGQLDEIWGRHARSKWLDNVSWVSFAAVGHPDTAEFISTNCGTYTVETTARTVASNGRGSRTRTLGERRLILPQEVTQTMRADEQIVFIQNAPPIRCGRAIFFRREDMRGLVGQSRFLSKAAPSQAGSGPSGAGLPPAPEPAE